MRKGWPGCGKAVVCLAAENGSKRARMSSRGLGQRVRQSVGRLRVRRSRGGGERKAGVEKGSKVHRQPAGW